MNLYVASMFGIYMNVQDTNKPENLPFLLENVSDPVHYLWNALYNIMR